MSLMGRGPADHMHDGLGFLTHHMALSRMFENVMQLVNPKVSLPYWVSTREYCPWPLFAARLLYAAPSHGVCIMSGDQS
jgi:hypothetical protein